MAKRTRTVYVCDNCGNEYLQWQGKCDFCQQWNTIKPVRDVAPISSSGLGESVDRAAIMNPPSLTEASSHDVDRIKTEISELDRVLGGGIVPGSMVLISGDPGVGKSTLLLQAAFKLANRGDRVLYVSGEESEGQVKNRAERLLSLHQNIAITPVTDVTLLATMSQAVKPKVIIIDSIQTLSHPDFPSSPGSMVQLRESAIVLQQISKRYGIATLIVGHITKQGTIAGPKVLEHIVDTVLSFDARSDQAYRLLRVDKNRYGDTSEVGVFSMTQQGFESVSDPAQYFLSERNVAPGSVLTVILEGARPLVLEVQALASKSSFGYPKRTASGYDTNRLQLLAAILERHTNAKVGECDIYVNVVGGLKVKEPAIDLAICVAIVSSLQDKALTDDLCLFGEVGLTGEVRKVVGYERREESIKRMGYKTLPFQTSLRAVLKRLDLI